ncbi:DUF952 domain-containing protein [Pelagibacterium montanilacus]|uniref:DUF952 domain-containing protein n=1 Tax=Pelagibacterium montanilacus TaxID=2185280 RepID=UPI000F8D3183|nr:DUF952 domain-containing protein [Pelagibacterium montanilacus]
MAEPIYKIATRTEWDRARAHGALEGTAADRADGYIHFSTLAQLKPTLDKHYRGQSDLVLAVVDPGRLGTALRWEPARGGDLFPHLYAPMPMGAVIAERTIGADADGQFSLPEDMG